MLQKSGCGGLSSDSIVMARYAALVQLLGDLVVDPGVPGGDHAVPDLAAAAVVVVHGVPEVNTEELGVQVDDVLVLGPLVHDVTGRRLRASLE